MELSKGLDDEDERRVFRQVKAVYYCAFLQKNISYRLKCS
jgi:hypothetical protein